MAFPHGIEFVHHLQDRVGLIAHVKPDGLKPGCPRILVCGELGSRLRHRVGRTLQKPPLAGRIFRRGAERRLTVARGTALDASMLVEELGDADRLLVHLASAPELAEILDDWEAPR